MESVWILAGRFHPVLVHFPIALLTVGGALRALAVVRGREGRAGSVMLQLGAVAAAVACVAGFAYADDGQFRGDALVLVEQHRNAAVAATVCAIAAALVDRFAVGPRALVATLGLLCAGVVGYAGHLGGTSVYGADHYTVGARGGEAVAEGGAPTRVAPPPGEAIDFVRDVQPIFADRCYRCHDKRKRKGGLRLDRKKYFLEGGDGGPSVVAGRPMASKLFQMINLPVDHEDYMPAKGDPIPPGEVEVIGRWIEQGAVWPDDA